MKNEQDKSGDLELIALAQELNHDFENGISANQVLEKIRVFPRPIAVDLNGVLANNSAPLAANPEAHPFLQELKQVGDIFIVTYARDFQTVYDFLKENGMWHEGMVLMTRTSWCATRKPSVSPGKDLIDDYIEQMAKAGKSFDKSDFLFCSLDKRVAPIFQKPWDVPIVDDTVTVTSGNPGMLGVLVNPWQPSKFFPPHKNGLKLQQAYEKVRDHYSKIKT